MSLFIYATDKPGRFSALNIAEDFEYASFKEDDKKTGKTLISRATTCGKRCNGRPVYDIVLDCINVPIEALEEFSDGVMAAGNQIKPLDLSIEGQIRMKTTYSYSEKAFENFIAEHLRP